MLSDTPAKTAMALPEAHATAREPERSAVRQWLRLAAHPATVRRALVTAAIVGSALIAINHGDALWRGDLDRARLAKMLLTVAVPYLVSTVSSVATRRELEQAAAK